VKETGGPARVPRFSFGGGNRARAQWPETPPAIAQDRAPRGGGARERRTVWDLKLGAQAREMPVASFIAYACGTNGGLPSLPPPGWLDDTRCRAEPETGCREVYWGRPVECAVNQRQGSGRLDGERSSRIDGVEIRGKTQLPASAHLGTTGSTRRTETPASRPRVDRKNAVGPSHDMGARARGAEAPRSCDACGGRVERRRRG